MFIFQVRGNREMIATMGKNVRPEQFIRLSKGFVTINVIDEYLKCLLYYAFFNPSPDEFKVKRHHETIVRILQTLIEMQTFDNLEHISRLLNACIYYENSVSVWRILENDLMTEKLP